MIPRTKTPPPTFASVAGAHREADSPVRGPLGVELLAVGRDEHSALGAPGRPDMRYDQLRALVAESVAVLNGIGVGRGDRVAIVLPNGPEMATAFIAVGSAATAAPLNPAYRVEEFEFYLEDLAPRAVIVAAGAEGAVAVAAAKLGIPLIDLAYRRDDAAGAFRLAVRDRRPAGTGTTGLAAVDDVALVLHTSGTTSRPKMVPLTHHNLVLSARNIAASLAFTAADRGLNVMPLFHIHGLIAGIAAPLYAGSHVCCTPGFDALRFFGWLDAVQPTWYTAVPTMHQALLARARGRRDVLARTRLRFVRSSSSPLPPTVMAELEATFRCPAIEAYGMTEASHQITSNPLPPATRKPGSVGVAGRTDVAVMDAQGTLLPPDSVGEVVIRGPSVTAGYVNASETNAGAMTAGWLRTGDLGVMDTDGYLRLTGRLKEIINRGGEKVSPREVDDVLTAHTAVMQAVTFAVPDAMLGEDLAAAVVLRDGMAATDAELRHHVAKHLADFKVPRRILFLSEIPRGPSGKLQRIGLAKLLGLA